MEESIRRRITQAQPDRNLAAAGQGIAMAARFVIFGAESIFTADYAETAERLGYQLAVVILDGEPEWDLAGLLSKRLDECAPGDRDLPCGIPWVTPGLKWE